MDTVDLGGSHADQNKEMMIRKIIIKGVQQILELKSRGGMFGFKENARKCTNTAQRLDLLLRSKISTEQPLCSYSQELRLVSVEGDERFTFLTHLTLSTSLIPSLKLL